VNSLPSSSFTFEPEVPVASKEVIFSAVAVGSVSWLWDFGDGTATDVQNPIHVYEELGDYTVTLMTTSAFGCTSVSSVDIGIITGIEKSPADNFELYPNPINSDKLVIRFSALNNVEISIFNLQGSSLNVSKSTEENQITLDVSALAEGAYLLKVIADGVTVGRKIVIVR
jgi:PKD repeat protein